MKVVLVVMFVKVVMVVVVVVVVMFLKVVMVVMVVIVVMFVKVVMVVVVVMAVAVVMEVAPNSVPELQCRGRYNSFCRISPSHQTPRPSCSPCSSL